MHILYHLSSRQSSRIALAAIKPVLEHLNAEPDCECSRNQHDRGHDNAKLEIIQRRDFHPTPAEQEQPENPIPVEATSLCGGGPVFGTHLTSLRFDKHPGKRYTALLLDVQRLQRLVAVSSGLHTRNQHAPRLSQMSGASLSLHTLTTHYACAQMASLTADDTQNSGVVIR